MSPSLHVPRARSLAADLRRAGEHGFGELARRIGLGVGLGGTKKKEAPQLGRARQRRERGRRRGRRGRAGGQIEPLAERVRLVAMELGPSFVKLGQIASTARRRPPADWVRELKKAPGRGHAARLRGHQDRDRVVARRSARQVLRELRREPLAAASIGQVHRAMLRTDDGNPRGRGEVQRPGAKRNGPRDLELLHRLARLIEQTVPSRVATRRRPRRSVRSRDHRRARLRAEADNAVRFRQNFRHRGRSVFPSSTKRRRASRSSRSSSCRARRSTTRSRKTASTARRSRACWSPSSSR